MSARGLSRTFLRKTLIALAFAFANFSALAGDLEDAEKAYARKDFAQAIALYRKAATQGDAAAQFNLGTMYAKGQGIAQNYQEAAALFLQSATQGYALAQNSLGVRYEKGQGVAQNPARAAALYREAAEQRFGLAQDNLSDLFAKGLGVTQDLVLAHVWSSLASANGESGAAKKRGVMERTMTQEQIAEATTHLGTMFARGRGVAQNARRAAQYFQNAAALGQPVAQFELAECYDKGSGVPLDRQQAVVWYEKSAVQGHARAQMSVAYMYEIGQGVSIDAGRAAYWYAQAAAQGEAIAQYNLGAMIESGRGVTQDHIEAHKWFNIAEVSGNARALESRRLVESLMTQEQIAEAQKRASEWMKEHLR
jgi:uncharacterized protein